MTSQSPTDLDLNLIWLHCLSCKLSHIPPPLQSEEPSKKRGLGIFIIAHSYWSLPTYQAIYAHYTCSQQPISIISPFYRWGNWDSKEFIYLPKVTQFLSGEEGFWSRQSPEPGLLNLVFRWVKGCVTSIPEVSLRPYLSENEVHMA